MTGRLLDAILILLPLAGMAFGWQVRAEKADRDEQKAYDAGYSDAIRHYGP